MDKKVGKPLKPMRANKSMLERSRESFSGLKYSHVLIRLLAALCNEAIGDGKTWKGLTPTTLRGTAAIRRSKFVFNSLRQLAHFLACGALGKSSYILCAESVKNVS